VKRALEAWAPPLALAVAIFLLSARSTLPVPVPPVSGIDKVGHFGVYAVLGWLLARAADRSGISLAWAAAAGIVYGATDEIHQAFVPGRTPEFLDWVADSAGVLTAVFLYHRWRRSRGRDGSRDPAAPDDDHLPRV
jgi:VanZ family protein